MFEKVKNMDSTRKKQLIVISIPLGILIIIGVALLIGISGGGSEVLLQYNTTEDYMNGEYSNGDVKTNTGISDENVVIEPEEEYYTETINVSDLEYINYSIDIEEEGVIKGSTTETTETENGTKISSIYHSSSVAITVNNAKSNEVVSGSPGGTESGKTVTDSVYVGDVDKIKIKLFIPDNEHLTCESDKCVNAEISNITVRSGE